MAQTFPAFSLLLPFFAFIFWLAIQFPFLRPVLSLGTLIVLFIFGMKSDIPRPPRAHPSPPAQQAIPLHPPGNP